MRDRCIEAGRQFYRERGVAPTSSEWWNEQTAYVTYNGRGYVNRGVLRPYPSFATVLGYWSTIRDFWNDVRLKYSNLGLVIDKQDTPWTPLEEWFITESIGLIGRAEVAEDGPHRTRHQNAGSPPRIPSRLIIVPWWS
jgi:hypothetical protein